MREYPGAPAGGQDLRGDVVPRSRSGFGSAPFSGASAAVLEILAADRARDHDRDARAARAALGGGPHAHSQPRYHDGSRQRPRPTALMRGEGRAASLAALRSWAA